MIYVCEPELGAKEIDNVVRCLKQGMISGTGGEFIGEFEEKFAAYCGKRFGVATTSGTTALHLAIASLGLGPGDGVITSTFTNAATVFAVVYQGATPVVVDSEDSTWNLDTSLIKNLITKRTRAIMPVHIYGHPCDMDPLLDLARQHGLRVIEDAAEAHGAEYKGKKAGGLSDIGCFSFYANKIITTGEGGMLVTDDLEVATQARILRNLAFAPERRFLHHNIGFNYRMSNIQAAIGVAQLEKIENFIARKREIARLYNSLLGEVPGVTLPPEMPWAKNVYWMYSILVDSKKFGMGRDELMASLAERGIETRTFFIPMNRQPAFHKMGLFLGQSCPVAERIGDEGLYLPSGVGLKEGEIRTVCQVIKELAVTGSGKAAGRRE